LKIIDGFLELSIRDDGKGMSRDPGDTGMGLMTMRRRAEMIDGEFSIQTSPGGGNHIRCRVPLLS
jgi:signal transduction histidine kinase